MIATWKAPHIVKGALTWVPILNTWRLSHASTGGSNSADYCYSVWLRHLVTLTEHGFTVSGSRVGELGPGDSLGVGVSAVLSGADAYVGLDVFPFSSSANLAQMGDDLIRLFERRAPIPADDQFPGVRPKMASYAFPERAVDFTNFSARVARLRSELSAGVATAGDGRLLNYRAPWSAQHVERGSLDVVLSQGVLQCVDPLEETYRDMFAWLKPGGYASHAVGFAATYLSPRWNGHWAYSDWQWRLVRGKREFLLNREPLSTHLRCARQAGFNVLHVGKEFEDGALPVHRLAARYRQMSPEDRETRFAMLILQKPTAA
jgi:hypothetical protein